MVLMVLRLRWRHSTMSIAIAATQIDCCVSVEFFRPKWVRSASISTDPIWFSLFRLRSATSIDSLAWIHLRPGVRATRDRHVRKTRSSNWTSSVLLFRHPAQWPDDQRWVIVELIYIDRAVVIGKMFLCSEDHVNWCWREWNRASPNRCIPLAFVRFVRPSTSSCCPVVESLYWIPVSMRALRASSTLDHVAMHSTSWRCSVCATMCPFRPMISSMSESMWTTLTSSLSFRRCYATHSVHEIHFCPHGRPSNVVWFAVNAMQSIAMSAASQWSVAAFCAASDDDASALSSAPYSRSNDADSSGSLSRQIWWWLCCWDCHRYCCNYRSLHWLNSHRYVRWWSMPHPLLTMWCCSLADLCFRCYHWSGRSSNLDKWSWYSHLYQHIARQSQEDRRPACSLE